MDLVEEARLLCRWTVMNLLQDVFIIRPSNRQTCFTEDGLRRQSKSNIAGLSNQGFENLTYFVVMSESTFLLYTVCFLDVFYEHTLRRNLKQSSMGSQSIQSGITIWTFLAKHTCSYIGQKVEMWSEWSQRHKVLYYPVYRAAAIIWMVICRMKCCDTII